MFATILHKQNSLIQAVSFLHPPPQKKNRNEMTGCAFDISYISLLVFSSRFWYRNSYAITRKPHREHHLHVNPLNGKHFHTVSVSSAPPPPEKKVLYMQYSRSILLLFFFSWGSWVGVPKYKVSKHYRFKLKLYCTRDKSI